MLEKFRHIIKADFDNFRDKTVHLAISGGKDSMALCELLIKCQLSPVLLHCNFNLRGADSNKDETFLREYAKKNNLIIHVKSFDTDTEVNSSNKSIQETARQLRYNWFKKFLIEKNAILLTAHHLNDSVETFFINLMRGSGLKGLTGINNNSDKILRPLLKFNQQQISDFIIINNIEFRQDQSNFENKYLRNKIRNRLIPLIEENSNQFIEKASKTIETLTEANDWIEEKAKKYRHEFILKKNEYHKLNIELLLKESSFFITKIMAPYGIRRSNSLEFKKNIKKNGRKFSSTTYEFLTVHDELIIMSKGQIKQTEPVIIVDIPSRINISNKGFQFSLLNSKLSYGEGFHQLDLSKIELPIIIRKWRTGDKIQPLGMIGTKLVSDVLIDKKINQFDKQFVNVLVNKKGELIAILDLMIADRFKLTASTKSILHIKCLDR